MRQATGDGVRLPAIDALAATEELNVARHLLALYAANDLESTMLATVSAGMRIGGAARAILFLADDASTEVVMSASCDGNGETAIARRSLRLDHSIVQSLLEADRVLVHDGEGASQQLARLLLESPYGWSYPLVLAPIRAGDKLLGGLLLEFPLPSRADLSQSRPLALFLEHAAVAIRKGRALNDLRSQVDGLSALATLDDALTRASDFEEMLGQIIERVKQLVDAERGGLMLYDAETDELIMGRPAFGAGEELSGRCRVPLDRLAGGNLLRAGAPYLSNDSDGGAVFLEHLGKPGAAGNVLAIPLKVGNGLVGVFAVANKRSGDFTEGDLRLSGLFASHLGLLIHNARLLEKERQTVHKLRELNQVVDGQREALQRTLAIHDELTQMVLDGQGIQAIVGILGRLLANPVSVEDRYQNLVAYYPSGDSGDIDEGRRLTILHGGTPQDIRDDPALQAIFARLRQERRPVRLPPIPRLGLDKARVFAPVVVGRETLAFVCVLESHRRLDDLDLMTLERAAVAIALQVMKEKAAAEERYKLRGDLVAELLAGGYGTDEMMLNRAAYLGIDLHVPRAVLVIDVDDFAGFASRRRAEDEILALKANLLGIIERTCRREARESVVSAKSDEIIVLAKVRPAGTEGHRAELHQLGDLLRSEVRRWVNEVSVSVGIGSYCDALADYQRSYRQARRALDVIKASDQRDRTLAFDQLGIYGLLFDVCSRDKLVSLIEDALGGLLEYDRSHTTDLTQTLDSYLRHNGHLEQTAGALHIHLNTLRYRLQRIGQITGAELHSFEARFNLQLALSVWRALNLR